MPGLAKLGMDEAAVTLQGKTSLHRRFYLSSVAMDAAYLATAARTHCPDREQPAPIAGCRFRRGPARNRYDRGLEKTSRR